TDPSPIEPHIKKSGSCHYFDLVKGFPHSKYLACFAFVKSKPQKSICPQMYRCALLITPGLVNSHGLGNVSGVNENLLFQFRSIKHVHMFSKGKHKPISLAIYHDSTVSLLVAIKPNLL